MDKHRIEQGYVALTPRVRIEQLSATVDLLKKIQIAEHQIERGEVVPHELAVLRLKKWLTSLS